MLKYGQFFTPAKHPIPIHKQETSTNIIMPVCNSTIAHNWAHQLKTHQSGSHFSFDGNKIYSYKTIIGEIVALKDGKLVYFLNTGQHTHSTGRHQCYTRGAIPVTAEIFSTSCDNFQRYSDSITDDEGKLSENCAKEFVVSHLNAFYSQLLEFRDSKALKNEEQFSFKWYDEAVRFNNLFQLTTVKKVLRMKNYELARWYKVSDPTAFRKVIAAVETGERNFQTLVDLALGNGAYDEYFERTKGCRANKLTRRINQYIGYKVGIGQFYVPYPYTWGRKNVCGLYPKNATYISKNLDGRGKGYTPKQLESFAKEGKLIETLYNTKKENFSEACFIKDNKLREERRYAAKGRLERFIGLRGFNSHNGCRYGRNAIRSFNYNGTVFEFNANYSTNAELTDEEYQSFCHMNDEERKQFIYNKRKWMLARLQAEKEEYDTRAERRQKLYEEQERRRKELESLDDETLRQWWHNGLTNASLWNKPNSFFFGGNVLLRVSGDVVETSKNIKIPIDECKRLWTTIKYWHDNRIEFERSSEKVHATSRTWQIERFQHEIMIAGCHAVAYNEMARVATELGFS